MFMVNKLKQQGKRRLIVIGLITIFVVISLVWYFVIRQKPSNGLSKKDEAAAKEAYEIVKGSIVTGGVDPTRIFEIDKSIRAKQYADAKKQIEVLLADGSVTKANKQTLYSQLAQICVALEDLGCADKVVEQYNSSSPADPYFLVSMAQIATKQKSTKAKVYYAKALEYLNGQGGEEKVKEFNNIYDPDLDYQAIKAGAQ